MDKKQLTYIVALIVLTIGAYFGYQLAEYNRYGRDVDTYLNDWFKQSPYVYEATGKDAKAADKDRVVIDFVGKLNGEAFQGGSAQSYPLVIGSNSFIAGFEEQIIGHTKGEKFEVNVTFPADYQSIDLAGKAVVFEVTLVDIESNPKKISSPNDEWATENSTAKDLNELKEMIKEQIVIPSKQQQTAN